VVGYGGYQSNANLFEAAVYTDQGGWTNLGFLPGGNWSRATATNSNGSVIVGRGTSPLVSSSSACYWDSNHVIHNIGNLLTGQEAEATAVNSNGTVIVGTDYLGSNQVAWRWTLATGMQNLGDLNFGNGGVYVTSVSSDGKVVVGAATVPSTGYYEAFIWDQAHGMRLLLNVLADQGLTKRLGYIDLIEATCIRGSGPYTICGNGFDSTGPMTFVCRLDSVNGAKLVHPKP
jgi:uncharacterized membrane protein